MPRTYLSTHSGDIDRWAAELDAVPVREEDGFAIVHEGGADLGQEQLHWDEFNAALDDEVVVRHRGGDGRDTLAVVDRFVLLDRLGLGRAQREELESHLEAGETVALPADESDVDGEVLAEIRNVGVTEAADDRRTVPDERDVGKPVVAANGDEVGMVTAIGEGELFADPHPGLTESALATLGWSGVDDDDVPVDVDRVQSITPTAVRLRDDGEREEFRETRTDH